MSKNEKKKKSERSNLEKLALVVGGYEKAQELISSSFQLKRLDELAEKNVFANLTYFQLISHINYAMLENDNAPAKMPKVPKVGGIGYEDQSAIVIANNYFPTTWDGRMSAIAQAFRHASNKIDDFLSLENLIKFTISIGTMTEIVTATLKASRVQQIQGLPPGYEIRPVID